MTVGIWTPWGEPIPFIITGKPLPPIPLLFLRKEAASGKIQVWILAGEKEEDFYRLFERGPGQFPLIVKGTLLPPEAEEFLQALLAKGECLLVGDNKLEGVFVKTFVVDIAE